MIKEFLRKDILSEGVGCVLVYTESLYATEGYLRDIELLVNYEDENIKWLEDLSTAYRDKSLFIKGFNFKELYDFIGIEAVYVNGVLKGIWFPLLYSEGSFDPYAQNIYCSFDNPKKKHYQPLINRARQKSDIPGIGDMYIYRLVCQEDIEGKDVDHTNRTPWDCRIHNLNPTTRKNNLGRQAKRYGCGMCRFKGVAFYNGTTNFHISTSDPINGNPGGRGFACEEERAALIYDWIKVFVDEVENYYWQIRPLGFNDIVPLIEDLHYKSFYIYIQVIWNRGERGKVCVKKLLDLIDRKLVYPRIDSRYRTIHVQMHIPGIKGSKYLDFDSLRDAYIFDYHFQRQVLKMEYELFPVFMNYEDLEELSSILQRAKKIDNYYYMLDLVKSLQEDNQDV